MTKSRLGWWAGPLALAGAAVFAAGAAERASFTVWAVHDGVKVRRDDREHPDRLRNAVWDGRTIRLVAARNEVIAFQLIVEANSGLDGLSATLPVLTRRGGGGALTYRAPAIDPTEYRDHPIQVFSEHYMSVTRASRATWVFQPDSPTAPTNALGWIPVQLVPENARPGRGGFPLRVDANRNQAFWFDIYVSRAIPPGSYRGNVRISARGGVRTIPVELDVLDVLLPDENTLPAMVYYQSDQPELYHGRNLDPAYHRFAKRHRVEFVHAYSPASARAALGRLTGRDFTRERGYEGPGEGVPNRIVPRTFYGPGADFKSLDAVWKAADEWMEFVEQQLPHARTFLYMPDEPRRPQFPEIIALGERLKNNPGKGRGLPTLVTRGYTPELAPAIDIWCAGPQHYDIDRAKSERAAGKSFWFYNGGRPAGGAIVIDSPATDPRLVGWAAFKHDADGYFYWHAAHWRHNNQKKTGDRNQDVWANPVTFDNRTEGKDDNGFINGDGVLVYPGEEKLHPEQDRGIAGPVSTIQMANLRRGLQDHALLTMARRLGLDKEIAAAVNRLVPRVFTEAVSDTIGFSEQGNDYEEARQRLLRAIARRRPAASAHFGMPVITTPVMFDTPEADAIVTSLQVFPPGNPWNQDISSLPVHKDSDAMIASIGADKPLNYNLDMGFVIVPAHQRRVPVKILEYPKESDPGPFPVPDNAPIENWPLARNESVSSLPKPGQTLGELQREGTGDRHVIVVDPGNGKLHEFWQTRKTDAGWEASTAASFDLRTGALRPERWTSADAAGLPIFPAVVRYDECARGMVAHAMRVTVRRTRRAYVLPATHWASRLRDPFLPRMGERIRLKKDFDLSGFPPHAQAVLRGLKKYGMFVADNGADWHMSIAPDRRLQGLESLTRVKGADFEVVETGARSVDGQ